MRCKKLLSPLLLIMLCATLLRFNQFQHQPFTYDEFSTLFRLDYDNLNDVIQIGMKELDNHPIGTQVFYYYYTKLFGESEMAVKFPILLFGIFAVFMVYRIAKEWFNSTAALYAASFMAFLQYAVAQSQVARMYGFGIPFVLIMVFYWHKMLTEKYSWKNALMFIFAASVCNYNHYFSLLFMAIVGVSGLFIVKKNDIKKYLLTGLAVFLIFVPQLNIFFYQLSKGGIEGWLGVFSFNYIFFYISYIYHHSWIVALAAIIPIILLFKAKVPQNNYRWISLVWFLLPIIIGFTYSYFVNNVTHERVFYFSFPFLLLFLASFIKKKNTKTEYILTAVLLILGSASLILERKHQTLFNKNRFELVADSRINWTENIKSNEILSVKLTNKRLDDYYNKKSNFTDTTTLFLEEDISSKEFFEMLHQSKAKYLYIGIAGVASPTYLQLAKAFFPGVIKSSQTIVGQAYLLKRGENNNDFCETVKYYKEFDSKDTIKKLLGTKSNDEYFGTVSFLLDTLISSNKNLIELSLTFMDLDSIGGTAVLVSDMVRDEKNVDWRSIPLDNYNYYDSAYNIAYYTVPIPDIKFKEGTNVKFYVWNAKKSSYLFKDFKMAVRQGNPFIYAGTDKIPYNLKDYCLVKK